MVEWSHPKTTRRRKYAPILEEVRQGQAGHGTAWAEIARFDSVQSGRSCAYQLKAKYHDFEFKSGVEDDECVVYARYIGDNDE